MKKNIYGILMLAFALALASCEGKKGDDSKEVAEEQNDSIQDESNQGNDLEKDSKFAVEAADAGMLEVQLGTLAKTRASSPRVKEYAQMMVDDHTKANNELKALAGTKNIVLPDVLSEDYQKKYYDMDQKKTGADFDKEYIDQMVKDHKDVIDKFEDQAEDGKDSEIKAWAAGKLAALRHHLQQAETIQESLKDTKRNN
jgi:putative membrane protein